MGCWFLLEVKKGGRRRLGRVPKLERLWELLGSIKRVREILILSSYRKRGL